MYRNVNFDSPYAANAPTWSDFGSSPNISSDYFDVLHPETETPFISVPEKLRGKRHDFTDSPLFTTQNGLLAPPGPSQSSSTFMDTIDTINMTPVKVVSPKGKKGQVEVVKETTVEDVLNNVMGIASSVTHQRRRAVNLNKTQGAPANADNTPAKPKRITRSMHHVEGIKTATPLAKPRVSNYRRSVAAQKHITPAKANNLIDLSAKNDAGVPIAKIIRTPVFNFKKQEVIKDNRPSVTEETRTTTLDIQDAMESTTLTKAQEVDKVKTVKPQSIDDNVSLHPLNLAVDLNEYSISSTPTPRPASTVVSNKLKKPESSSNKPKWQKPAPPATAQPIQSQDDVYPSTTAADSATAVHPEEEIDDEDYEEIFEQIEDFEEYIVRKNRLIEKRKPRGAHPSVLTSHARRRSSILKNRRLSNHQYVSLAEAVKKFEKDTPTRFHTVSKKPNAKAVQMIKQQSLKRTIPISPALASKSRVRRHVVLSQAELEEIELQKMKQHKIRANPVPTNILQAPQPLQTVTRKPLTSQKPFHLSKPKKLVTSKQVPIPSTSSSSSSVSGQCRQSKKPVNKVVPTVVSSEGGVIITETQIMHFGIPTTQKAQIIGSAKKKTTRPLPFNFEARNKLFMSKKEEKLKKLQSEEEKKARVEFHARPMPLSVKKLPLQASKQVKLPAKEQELKEEQQEKARAKVLPFSFEARDKGMLLKKKDELRKKLDEEVKKSRNFHANPAPHFKPVLVRGRSRENIKTDEKNPGTIRNRSADNSRTILASQSRGRSAENLRTMIRDNSKESLKAPGAGRTIQRNISLTQLSVHTDGDEENRPPNNQPAITKEKSASVKSNMPLLKPKLKSLPAELHSDKRARVRKEFDEQIRMKDAMREEKRRRDQEERLAREQAEIRELRQKSKVKARPMPVYKPMAVIKSTKPLTAPASPAWAKSRP